jgi:cation transport regulator ChaC
MDSHYDQVMNARKNAPEAGERLYFAYSTILDRAAFEEWRSQHAYGFFDLPAGEKATALDVSLIYDFPSRWWGGRVAGLADTAGERVHGLVFKIASRDWPIIQHKEGFVTHMCVEREVQVETAAGVVTATAFTTAPNRKSSDGPVSTRFVEALVRGARSAGLPEDYVEKLSSTPS